MPAGRAGRAPVPIVQPAAGEKLSDGQIVDKANAALNSVTSMAADFTQVGGDGRRHTGMLYLQRPGKLRFEYEKPSTLEIVSDGSTVLVRDRKLNTSDPYPISQTPLKFLLSSKIDLGRESKVTAVATDPEGVRVSIEDSTTLGGTSKITLTFDPQITTLCKIVRYKACIDMLRTPCMIHGFKGEEPCKRCRNEDVSARRFHIQCPASSPSGMRVWTACLRSATPCSERASI